MTILCSGDCHVWLGASSLCTCEAHRVAMNKYVTITQCFDTGYISYHPELPTVISQADTPEEARANLIEATEMAVRHLAENGLPVPQPLAFPLAVDLAMMYGFPANYNPFGPHAPQPTPTAPDVPLSQFHAAQAIKDATHLSSDGQRVYSQRMGNVRVYYWDDETKAYGSSFPCPEGLPADAVVIERSGEN